PSAYPINTIYLWTSGPEEAVMQVALKGLSTEALKERLRKRFAAELPDVRFSFEPADIVSRVMSFGSFTPIEVDVSGPNLDASQTYAAQIETALRRVPWLRDVDCAELRLSDHARGGRP
ncbi:MAG: hypothetical protein ACYCW6_17070, partial [Candidatus Xenobia bacterium]